MRKVFFACISLSLIFLTGCDRISEIENKSIITACAAIHGDNTKYGFYISVPSGSEGGEEEGSKSSAKYYEFEADNFNSALMDFKESVSDDVDISHMNLFAANEAYYRDKFKDDEKYLSRRISVSSLVDVCMILCTEQELFDCIGSEYDSKASDFSESILTELEMNLSKLSLAVHNKNYTAKIPVVSLHERGKLKLPEVYTMSYYNSDNSYSVIPPEDYKLLKAKHALQDGEKCKLKIKSDICIAETDDRELATMAQKYAFRGVDILNIRYYGKKEFLYYEKYLRYFDKLNLSEVSFVGNDI